MNAASDSEIRLDPQQNIVRIPRLSDSGIAKLRATTDKFFIESAHINWPSIYDADAAETESMSKRYEITTIPTAILVDREGNIVAFEARGEKLPKLLAEFFDVTEADSSKAPNTADEDL